MKKIILVLFFGLSLGFILNANNLREDTQTLENLNSTSDVYSNDDVKICYFWYTEKYMDGTSITYSIAYPCGQLAQLMAALP